MSCATFRRWQLVFKDKVTDQGRLLSGLELSIIYLLLLQAFLGTIYFRILIVLTIKPNSNSQDTLAVCIYEIQN